MNLNMFRVLSPAETAALQQFADQERWIVESLAMGASLQALLDYDAQALAYAQTTPYPNQRIVSEARRAAREALLCGKPLPTDVQAAIQTMWARDMARILST